MESVGGVSWRCHLAVSVDESIGESVGGVGWRVSWRCQLAMSVCDVVEI